MLTCIILQTIQLKERNGINSVKLSAIVADMSSDILSRQMDFNRFALIYAGAQKNMGAAGVNLVVVNKNILGKVRTCHSYNA